MKLSTTLATAAMTTALALCVSTGTGTADPAPQTEVRYEVSRQGDSAVLSTDGKLQVVDGQLLLTTGADTPVAALPLTYRMDDKVFPIAATIDGGTATLTPSREGGAPVAAATNVITQDAAARQIAESFTPRDQAALGVLSQRLGVGGAVAAIVGAVVGGGVGCLVGGAAGAAIASPVIVLLVPWVGATVAGCVLGAATLGAVGTMLGLVTVGGPLAVFSAYQYFSTILAPCPADLGAYCKDPAVPTPPK
ncbi:hypothetical protein [Nocardia alba]|uniref:DUF8020 domain-containing protein n=1 Tax=Nocardia alba TaxID=225051 RepID=A0A4R1FER8_9NOCA|nr:hypothetical protein [Nocardia alba]TCJ93266.1 hypothetical protein DFR71_5908 [Nocardia alba]